MDMNKKLEEVCRLFRIEGTFVGYETIQVGMTGLLTWQEGNMLDFVPDEEDAE